MAYIGEQQFRQQQGGGFDPYKLLSIMALLNRMGGTQQTGVTDASALLTGLGQLNADSPPELADELINRAKDYDWGENDGMENLADIVIDKYTAGAEQRNVLLTKLKDLDAVGNVVEKAAQTGNPFTSEERNSLMKSIDWIEKNELVIDDFGGKMLNQKMDNYLSGFQLGLEMEHAVDILGKVRDPRKETLLNIFKKGGDLMTPDVPFGPGSGFVLPGGDEAEKYLAEIKINEIASKIPIITKSDKISSDVDWLRRDLKFTKEGLEFEGEVLPDDFVENSLKGEWFPALRKSIEEVEREMAKSTDLWDGPSGTFVKRINLDNQQTMDALNVVMRDISGGKEHLAIMWNEGAEPSSILAVNQAWHMPSAQRGGGGATDEQRMKRVGDMVRAHSELYKNTITQTLSVIPGMKDDMERMATWGISGNPTFEILGNQRNLSAVATVKMLDANGGLKKLGAGDWSKNKKTGEPVDVKKLIESAILGNKMAANEIMNKWYNLYVHQGGAAAGEWRTDVSMQRYDEGVPQYNYVANIDLSWAPKNMGDNKKNALKAYVDYWKFHDDMMKYPWGSIHDYLGGVFPGQSERNVRNALDNIDPATLLEDTQSLSMERIRERFPVKSDAIDNSISMISSVSDSSVAPPGPLDSVMDSLTTAFSSSPLDSLSSSLDTLEAQPDSMYALQAEPTMEERIAEYEQIKSDAPLFGPGSNVRHLDPRLEYDMTTMEMTKKDSAYIKNTTQEMLASPTAMNEKEIKKMLTDDLMDQKQMYQYRMDAGPRLDEALSKLDRESRAMAYAQRDVSNQRLSLENLEEVSDISNPQNMKDVVRFAKRDLKEARKWFLEVKDIPGARDAPYAYANQLLQLSKSIERMRDIDMNPAVAKEFKKLMKVLTSHTKNLSPEIVELIESLRSLPSGGITASSS